VEAALARVQAELSIIPEAANHEIVRKAHVKYLDFGAEPAWLASIGDTAPSGSKLRATAP
jgi:hypothetical protein